MRRVTSALTTRSSRKKSIVCREQTFAGANVILNITAHVRDSNSTIESLIFSPLLFLLKKWSIVRQTLRSPRKGHSREFYYILPYQRYGLQHDGRATVMIFIHPCRNYRFTIQFAMEGALRGIRFVSPRESLREFALVIGPGRIGNDFRSSFSSRTAPPPNRFLDKVDENGLEEYSKRRHIVSLPCHHSSKC